MLNNELEKPVAPFKFKQFTINQDQCPMKIGTDGVLLGAWADITGALTILDIGTGTGVIAIMLGQRSEEKAIIHGVEIDENAYNQANENMEKAPWSDRLQVINASIQDYARQSGRKYDLIVSNPPFFSGGTFSNNQDRNLVRHTVKLPNGDLLRSVRSLLASNGRFCVILPYIEGLRFQEMAKTYNLHCVKITEVYPKKGKKIERLMMQFEQEEGPLEVTQLVIQKEARNDFTDEYIQLTGEFYLNM